MHPGKVVTLIVLADAPDRGIRAAAITFVKGQIVIKHRESIESCIRRTIMIVWCNLVFFVRKSDRRRIKFGDDAIAPKSNDQFCY